MNGLRIFLSATVICIPWMPAIGFAEDFAYPSTMTIKEVRGWIDRCKVDHPRLLISGEELTQREKQHEANPLAKATAQEIVRQSDMLLDVPPIERKLKGKRLLGESRRCVKRLLTLSMAFHLTGNRKYVERAEKEMLVVAAFADWNPSHFLDVAEMTFAMAIGYDWLFHELNKDNRTTIRAAIIKTGQFPALACGPSGRYFNYADGGSGRGADPTLGWFADLKMSRIGHSGNQVAAGDLIRKSYQEVKRVRLRVR